MATFIYKAISTNGKRSRGLIDAHSLAEAKEKVKTQGILLLDIQETKAKSPSTSSQFDFEALVLFTTQLSQLIQAQVPLHESLIALEEQARGEKYHGIIEALTDRIKRGQSFSKSLGEFPDSFPPLFRAAVQAGESAGALGMCLEKIALFYQKSNRVRKQLVSALIYPVTLFVLLIVAFSILMGFVIPALEGLFEGKALPPFTSLILSLSHFFTTTWPILLCALLGSGVAFYFWLKRNGMKRIEKQLMKLPIIGSFIIHSSLGRFATTLSMLLSGGIPLAQAIDLAKEALYNKTLEESISSARDKMIEGSRFSTEIGSIKQIPPLFSRMFRIGEETGRLDPILEEVGKMYEEEADRLLNRTLSLLQPALLLIMGVMVGSTLLAILLPLSDFSSGFDMNP